MKNSLLRILFVLLTLVFSADWCAAQKIQYDCRGCTLTDSAKYKIQKIVEYETAYFAKVFGPRRKQNIRIRYYADQQKFKKAQRLMVGRVASTTGIYATASRLVMIFKSEHFLQTSFHECTHAIYHHHATFRPDWINEGLAEYFKGAVVDSLDSIRIDPLWGRKLEMRKMVSDSSFSFLSTVKASYNKFHRFHESENYTKSWGLVYYLRMQYDELFSTILYKVSHGLRSDKVLEEEYPGGLEQLRRDLIRFYK